MSRKRIKIILRKEWRTIFSDLNNVFLTTLLPLLIMGEGILYVWLANNFGGQGILDSAFFKGALDKFLQAQPQALLLTPPEQVQLFLLNQFNFFLLLIPTMIAITLSAFSIIEEKLSRSLEPLLATPVRTWELLLAKALAGAIPALLITWICAGLFLIGITGIGWGNLIGTLTNPTWYINLFLLTPVITVLSFLLGLIGSARAKDAKGAMNLAVCIILPVFGLIAIQVTGIVWFSTIGLLLLAIGIGLIDVLVLRIAVRLFQREAIVIKWR
jgi:ABC-type Na+ efflux pump permease subunit